VSDLTPNSALDGFAQRWTGFSLTERLDYELVLLTVAKGENTTFAKLFKKHLKSKLPKPNQILSMEDGFCMWLEPDKYLLMLNRSDVEADKKLTAAFGDSAYAVLLSDGWACLKVEGEHTLDVFERFIPLNLRQAPNDFATRTGAHHISVIVACLLNGSYLLLTPRSSAQSFLEALTHVADNVLGSPQI